MRVDVHAHHFTHAFLDLMSDLGTSPTELAPSRQATHDSPELDLAQRFASMEAAGVTRQVLSAGALVPSFASADAAVLAARAINDEYAALCDQHPDRFSFLTAIPLPHADATLAEIARTAPHPGCLGVTATTATIGALLDEPANEPVFASLSEREAVLLVHPVGDACGSPAIAAEQLTWPIGAPFEDTLFVLRLLRSGWLDRYPGIKLVVPHLGGTLPFLMERLDYMSPRFLLDGRQASTESRRLWFDSVNGHPAALRCAVDTLGADRILLGTDYPMWRGEAHTLAVEYVTRSELPAETVAAILHGNASALFSTTWT